jgi:hypothetical protein
MKDELEEVPRSTFTVANGSITKADGYEVLRVRRWST